MTTALAVVVFVVIVFVAVQVYIRKRIVEVNPTRSFATHPGGVRPSRSRLWALAPSIYTYSLSWKEQKSAYWKRIAISMRLWFGASNPAVVVQEKPFIVAAYAADCDAVLLVRFLPETVLDLEKKGVNVKVGARLLSINTYFERGTEPEDDEIELGPQQTGLWPSFRPYIAEVMSNDFAEIERRKRDISPLMWERVRELGVQKLQNTSDLDKVRWGNPLYVAVPGSYETAIAFAEAWQVEH